MNKEPLQQALDALELANRTSYSESNCIKFSEAIKSIRAAIAQPVQPASELEQQNQQLRDQNTALDAACADQEYEIDRLRTALKFYADKEHFDILDDEVWDTVSGEPQNLWYDEASTAAVEDGAIARAALSPTPKAPQ